VIERNLTLALVGNPNTGKSTVFNLLTGLKQKVGNYPGITVERKTGNIQWNGFTHEVIDLPGTYSLNPKTVDERIAYQTLTGEYEHEQQPDLVMIVVDASNLDRNLFFVTQVMDLGLPVVILLNMMDIAEDRGIIVKPDKLEKNLGVPVIPLNAKRSENREKVLQAIHSHSLEPSPRLIWKPDQVLHGAMNIVIEEWLKPHTRKPENSWQIESLKLIGGDFSNVQAAELEENGAMEIIERARDYIEKKGDNWMAKEVMQRYDFINEATGDVASKYKEQTTWTDRIDSVVTNKFAGPVIFVAILLVMFQSIFTWAEPFMDLIEFAFIEAGNFVSNYLPSGILNDLVVEGILAGLGGVVVFLPQIMFLFFFISILEQTGYMARAAFVMDGFMNKIGLHGRSVVPLMSGFACAIPGIMATRTIENWKDRLITIMVLPFMACSARLPVYALLIAAFIPSDSILGFLSLQGLTFFGLYLFGIVTALIAAFVFKKIFTDHEPKPFIMELPSYKAPDFRAVIQNMVERGWLFVTEAGRIIIAISIVLWFLASYPKVDTGDGTIPAETIAQKEIVEEKSEGEAIDSSEADNQQMLASKQLRNSYAGQFGQFIEPVIKPIGFDWKIGIGLLTSFAAREVMVGTLNTIYSVGDTGDDVVTLKQKMINDVNPDTGKPVYSVLTAISLMVFFALAMQCMSTLAIVRRETNTWKWPIVMLLYMTGLAYLSSLAVYQGGQYFLG